MSGLFARSVLWDMLAPALILLTPIVTFVSYHGYGYFSVEVLAGLGAAVLVGAAAGLAMWKSPAWLRAGIIALLMTAYVDIQFYRVLQTFGDYWPGILLVCVFAFVVVCGLVLRRNLTQILAVVFATMIAATVAVPSHGEISRTVTADVSRKPDPNLPTVIHIIFDEHIGVEGIPTDIEGGAALKEEIKSFYRERGFYVFGKAFTRFEFTTWSISHLLNKMNGFSGNLFGYGKDDHMFSLKNSSYFGDFSKRGYEFNIYQTKYLDYCSSLEPNAKKCMTYNFKSMKNLKQLPLKWTKKLQLLSVYILSESVLYKLASKIYWNISMFLDRSGALEATWHGEQINVIGPVTSLQALDFLEQDLPEAPPGSYFFAHLMIPHFPFVYDGSCSLTDPSLWTNSWIPAYIPEDSNTARLRDARYRRYFGQVRCVYKRLARFLDTVDNTPALANAVILLHGDHGARITTSERERRERGDAAPSDYVVAFSTLMAVRSAGIAPGYSQDPMPIQGLLDRLRATGFDSLPEGDDSPMPQTIFLMPHLMPPEGEAWTTIPMPEFGAAATR